VEAFQAPYASICLLSYNRAKSVRRTISSAITSAGYPFELIVHDDGSDEETVEVLREFHRNGLISLLLLNAPNHNEGQGIALERMFRAATGDPIVKMDQDLEFEPDWLKQSVHLIEKNFHNDEAQPRIGCLGLFKYHHPPVHHEDMLIATRRAADVKFEMVKDFVGSCMVIPRAAYERFGPFETRSPAFAEDAVFKQRVEADPDWTNALFPEDLAANFGFGLGPSTVAIQDPNEREGVAMPAPIHDRPFLIEGA
jgi:glycosyltransferase involved in cell wall biosynthesis